MKYTSVFAAAVFAVSTFHTNSAFAQSDDEPVSQCLAIAQSIPNVIFASANASPLQVSAGVTITYSGHSTYRITSPEGIIAATDYSGIFGSKPVLPRIVTMNRAHSSHYTLYPDEDIEFVLTGWNDEGPGPIDHDLVVDDMYVRNVATDIRSWESDHMQANGNSIFIFEVAGLCIGHMGHLHHPLTDDHFAQIGRLDIVMVPVDGGMTLSHNAMAELTKRLQSSIVLPMHLRNSSIQAFTCKMGPEWKTEYLDNDSFEIDVRSLPSQPTIKIPPSLLSGRG